METNDVFSKLAWERAFALAKSYGHRWAIILDAGQPQRPLPWDKGACSVNKVIDSVRVDATENEREHGIFPCVEDGYLSHRSGTGRTRWDVDPGGTTSVAISRPAGDCLSLILRSNGVVYLPMKVKTARYRHWEALMNAASALDCAETVSLQEPQAVTQARIAIQDAREAARHRGLSEAEARFDDVYEREVAKCDKELDAIYEPAL